MHTLLVMVNVPRQYCMSRSRGVLGQEGPRGNVHHFLTLSGAPRYVGGPGFLSWMEVESTTILTSDLSINPLSRCNEVPARYTFQLPRYTFQL